MLSAQQFSLQDPKRNECCWRREDKLQRYPISSALGSAIGFAMVLCASSAMAEPACGLYQYKATITKVYDGDTITADIDLGFNTWRRNEHLRLDGIDAPEMRGGDPAAATAARDALADRILGKELVICTIKDRQEKYGRYLVRIYIGDELINDWLVNAGHAVPYAGGKRSDLVSQSVVVAQSWNCQPRRTCPQIDSCEEARWYLSNCPWGGRLDRDGDGIPCESIC